MAQIQFSKNVRKKKKLFDNNGKVIVNEEEHFKVTYFFVRMNQAIKSLNKCLKQVEPFSTNFGFLYHIGKLRVTQDDKLMKCCKDQQILQNNSTEFNKFRQIFKRNI